MSYGVALRNGVPFTLGTIAALCVNATGSAWSPADLVSLGAWYDPSDLTTMFQDAAGTTPVTAAGQPVGLILDKSGNGYHASQSTSTARPLLQIDGSGNYYLAFDGVDDYLSTSAIDLTGTDKVTMFTGALVTSSAVAVYIETNTTAVAGGSFGATANESSPNLSAFIAAGGNFALAKLTTAPPARAVTTVEYSSAFTAGVPVAVPRVNGSDAAFSIEFANNSGGNFGNWPLYIGARSTPAYFFNGNIYSLIIGGAAYDAATVLNAEAWVADKSGVTL
jgi:hypothetical protein